MSIYQGDPAIKITINGASMTFKGGQPVMDKGLNNATLISLFTKRGWWGNTLAKNEAEKIGSDYENQRTIVEVQTINDYNNAIDIALKWMKDTKLVGKIERNVTNPYNDQIKVNITLYPPGQDAQKLLFLKNGINWIEQAQNPVNERL